MRQAAVTGGPADGPRVQRAPSTSRGGGVDRRPQQVVSAVDHGIRRDPDQPRRNRLVDDLVRVLDLGHPAHHEQVRRLREHGTPTDQTLRARRHRRQEASHRRGHRGRYLGPGQQLVRTVDTPQSRHDEER